MVRSALPQNYILNSGSLFEDFETLSDWTAGGDYPGRVMEANTSQYLTGSQSLKLGRSILSGATSASKTINQTFPDNTVFRLGAYLHTAIGTFNKVYLQLSSTTDWSKYMTCIFRPVHVRQGAWCYLVCKTPDFTASGGELWTNTMIRMRVVAEAITGQMVTVSVDELRIGMEYSPRLLLMFDDNRSTVYSIAYPCMDAHGIRGTIYTIKNLVGYDANYMTLANLQEVYGVGWAIANHTTTHAGNLTTLTQAEVESELSTCTNYLIANGMPRAAKHVAYPLGQVNDTVLAAVAALQMVTGRSNTASSTELYPQQFTPVGNIDMLNAFYVDRTTTLAAVKSLVDKAYGKGVTLSLLFHRFAETPTESTQWSTANFQGLVDYIVARRIPCVTIDDWYRGLTDPRIPVDR